jgi:ribokinase
LTSRTKRRVWDVVVFGGANTDYLIRGERLPGPGETVDGCEFLKAAGGKGANQAVAAARLGARVGFIGKVGADDSGKELIRGLKAEGIDTRCVSRDRRRPSGAALIMVDASGEKAILTAPGANHEVTIADCDRAAAVIRNARVLLVQFEVPIRVVTHAVQLANGAGAKVVLDPAPPQGRVTKSLLACVDLIRPNTSEAQALTGIMVTDRRTAMRAAHRLFKAGVRSAVAIQAGEDGDMLVIRQSPETPVLLPRMKVRTVDATGAGDAYAAGLAVALALEQPYSVAGPFASAAAALATTRFGAQPAMPRLAEVLALMRREGFRKEANAIEN